MDALSATTSRMQRLRASQLVELSLLSLTVAAWLLVLLAQVGAFGVAFAAILPLALALASAALAWWRSSLFARIAGAGVLIVAALLYLPPAQQLPLSGDAAIYPNEGAWLARTGALVGTHPALAVLSPGAADLFYINSSEQFGIGRGLAAYEGLIYGGYYVEDAASATIQSSRMPQVIAWHGLLTLLFGGRSLVFLVSALFAAGVMLLMYAVGSRLYSHWIAVWAALALGICYPQIYLARGSLAEMTGAFWTLAGVWFAVLWLRVRAPRHLLLALLMWVTSWSARVDALLLLAPAALLVAIAAIFRDRAALKSLAFGLPVLALLAVAGANHTYVAATMEIATASLDLLAPALIVLLAAGPVAVALCWRWGDALVHQWKRIERPCLALLWLTIAGVVAWATVPGPWRDAEVTRPFQEIIWFSSLYITPAIYWLATIGIGVLFWRGLTPLSLFLTGTLLVLAIAYLHGYTSANVYPISIRRLASDLLPVMMLVAGYAFTLEWPSRWRRHVAAAVGVASLLWIAVWAAPLFWQRENPDDLAFVAALHGALPNDAAIIFEPQDGDSWIGWLAAPLFSVYGDWALPLQFDTPDPVIYAEAIDQLIAAQRTPVVASQSMPLPDALLPEGMQATEILATTWHSAQLGQVRPPDEPVYWQFALPLHLYRLEGTDADASHSD